MGNEMRAASNKRRPTSTDLRRAVRERLGSMVPNRGWGDLWAASKELWATGSEPRAAGNKRLTVDIGQRTSGTRASACLAASNRPVLSQKMPITFAVVALSALTGLVMACRAPEPGIPSLAPSPLFPGYGSYQTLRDLQARLPARATWRVIFDRKSSPRGSCPRFDQLTLVVPEKHLGHTGMLQLTFINERLEQTLFTPNDFEAYLSELVRAGTRFDSEGNATAPPATRIWRSNPIYGRFIGWRDERFGDHVRRWINQCA